MQKAIIMSALQEQYDEAMFQFSQGELNTAIDMLRSILDSDLAYFDARLALGMAYSRQGNQSAAIAEGHKAEKLKPDDPLVHTNLSLFYMKSGDKKTAEHHGLKARVASWKGNMAPPPPAGEALPQAPPAAPAQFPDMPWKRAEKPVKPNT